MINPCILYDIFCLHLIVVDVSSQRCFIIPTSPDGLDRTGGVIVDGTNVTIECFCFDEDGDVPQRIRWFDPNTRIITQHYAPVGYPYTSDDAPTTLVIPTFSYSTSGVYTCGIGNSYPPVPMVTINLAINGKC